jgi:putative transposase
LKKYEKKLAKAQRKLKKKQFVDKNIRGEIVKIPSNRRQKQNIKIKKIYRKTRNSRMNFLHQTTYHMITKYDGFSVETLKIKEMLKQNKEKHSKGKAAAFNRSIADVSLFEFFRQLEYKSDWYGKWFFRIGQYEPSSQLCSRCGNMMHMPLENRIYICSNKSCNMIMHRDLNSSISIKDIGISDYKKSLAGNRKIAGNSKNTAGIAEIDANSVNARGLPAIAGRKKREKICLRSKA